MNDRLHEQLDKILALADSSHDAEALVAVRKARQLLSRDGLSFGDLSRAASAGYKSLKSPALTTFLSGQRDHMESQIAHLRQQLEDLQAQMQTQELQLDFWRRRAAEMEQSSTHAQSEADKWKKLASETADQLWEMGRSLGAEEFIAPTQIAAGGKK